MRFKIVIGLIFLILVSLSYLLAINNNDIKHEQNKKTAKTTSVIPKLPNGIQWEIVNINEQKKNMIRWIKSDEEFGKMMLSGKEWVYYKDIKNVDEEYNNGIYSTFKLEFPNGSGWYESFSYVDKHMGNPLINIQTGEYRLLGNINYPNVANSTFAKQFKDQIIFINYYESVDDKYIIPHMGSLDYTYPHPREFRIFISDPVTVENLIKNRITLTNDQWYKDL